MKHALISVLLFFPMISMSHDGDHCSNPLLQNQKGISTGVQSMFGQFDNGATEFDYFVVAPSVGYSYKNKFLFTATLPLVSLANSGNRDFAISDLQVNLQGSVLTWGERNFMSLGLTSEFPTGDEEKLVGGGHAHYRPYVGLQQNFRHIIGYAQAGFLFAAKHHDESSLDHDHAANEAADHHIEPIHGSIVDVHSSQEATFQLGGIFPVMNELFFNMNVAGQTVLTNTNASIGDFYMSANPALTLMLNENSNITMFSQIPVTTLKRFDYRFGAGINYIF